MIKSKKSGTRTRSFGTSNREGHDASAFYERFTPPIISDDETLAEQRVVDRLICGNAKQMSEIPDNSVALIVTSPPYFVGKDYELALNNGDIPNSYLEYLAMLRDVFAECVRVLEPGGRIAVNVANLGRKPYRSLSADVIRILQDELALLLRGEVIWIKAKGASGSCAWGSFQSAVNPVFRDLSERIIIASKGNFRRAVKRKVREEKGLPFENTISKPEFMELTLDVWNFPPESAKRIGHPAPFPVELPRRLIELYTFKGDLVLDPFSGSGSTAIAALRSDRHYVGYDLDPDYVALAQQRLESEKAERA